MATRVLEAQQTINQASEEKPDTLTVISITADKGYYAVSELQALQQEGIRTVICDPIDHRRMDKLEAQEQRVVRGAKRTVRSKSGKELLRRRGMHIERSFAHILDAGGMRRTTLRGWENLNKRFQLAAAFYNLSQLMRKLFGFGTPKQLAAVLKRAGGTLFSASARLFMALSAILHAITDASASNRRAPSKSFAALANSPR
jgi:transposase